MYGRVGKGVLEKKVALIHLNAQYIHDDDDMPYHPLIYHHTGSKSYHDIQRRMASFVPARDFSAFRFLPSFRNDISYPLKEHYE